MSLELQLKSEIKNIDGFCKYLSKFFKGDLTSFLEKTINVAQLFINYFCLQHPVTFQQLESICNISDIELKPLQGVHQPRGYNFVYKDSMQIYFRENDSPSGKINTILHELYEIICSKLLSNTGNKKSIKKKFEQNANQFSVNVCVPFNGVLNYLMNNDLDVFAVRREFECSYVTALIIFNSVLCYIAESKTALTIPIISLLFERCYWKQKPNGRNPRLQLTCFRKSIGFPFSLRKSETAKLVLFAVALQKHLTVRQLIKPFYNYKHNVLIKNLDLLYEDYLLTVDVLIRTVNWRDYRGTAKILLQIIPSKFSALRILAEEKNFEIVDFGKKEGI